MQVHNARNDITSFNGATVVRGKTRKLKWVFPLKELEEIRQEWCPNLVLPVKLSEGKDTYKMTIGKGKYGTTVFNTYKHKKTCSNPTHTISYEQLRDAIIDYEISIEKSQEPTSPGNLLRFKDYLADKINKLKKTLEIFYIKIHNM